MDTQWTLICTFHEVYKAELIKGLLIDNGIDSVVVNKVDSIYLIGEAEVYVAPSDVIRARQIIKEAEGE